MEVDRGFEGPMAELPKHRAGRIATALQRLLDGKAAPADGPIPVALGRRQPTSG